MNDELRDTLIHLRARRVESLAMQDTLRVEAERDALQRRLDAVQAILADEWIRGRVLPRVIGAEDQARIRALRALLSADTEEAGR